MQLHKKMKSFNLNILVIFFYQNPLRNKKVIGVWKSRESSRGNRYICDLQMAS